MLDITRQFFQMTSYKEGEISLKVPLSQRNLGESKVLYSIRKSLETSFNF